MSSGDNIELLRDLRRQSIAAAYIGDCLANAPGGRKARLSIGFATADDAIYTGRSQGPCDLALRAPSITPLAALCALCRTAPDDDGTRGVQS